MPAPTDKFDTPSGGGGGGGSSGNNGIPAKNFSDGTFNFVDGDGKVIKSVGLNDNNQAIYTKTLTADDLGGKTLQSRFTGDSTRRAGQSDSFTMQVTRANGQNVSASGAGTVNQIVAGPGIYISAPNGQGIVTISTSPIPTQPNVEDLYDIAWSVLSGSVSNNVQGQFTAVGKNGVNLRSRDGFNWTSMPATTGITRITGVAGLMSSSVSDGHVEYIGYCEVTSTTTQHVAIGRLGYSGDGMVNTQVVSSQSQPITFNLSVPYVFPYSGGVLWLSSGLDINNGIIVSGKPTDQVTVEVTTGQHEEIQQMAANNTNNSVGFTVIAAAGETKLVNGQWQVVEGSGNGKIYVSSRSGATPQSWSPAYTSNSQIFAAAYGNGVWICAGANNKVYRSTNASSWTEINGALPKAIWWYGAYGNGKFVMVGFIKIRNKEQACVMYSEDQGLTWKKGNPGTNGRLYGLAYSPELNVFVGVGAGGALVTVKG